MKVGTDGVILGSWTPVVGHRRALDVGTGTGLIALMLAQRNDSLHVDAVEIDTDAANQAKENVVNSPFSDRIHVFCRDFREHAIISKEKYDLIVTNPPYFSGSMKPFSAGRILARHTDQLNPDELLMGIDNMLSDKGVFSIIIPLINAEGMIDLSEKFDLFPYKKMWIKPTPDKGPLRVCITFSRTKTEAEEESMVIEAFGRHGYSKEFKALTKEFYLNS